MPLIRAEEMHAPVSNCMLNKPLHMPPPEFRISYRPEQRDSRTPLWYKLLYMGLGLLSVLFVVVVGAGAVYQARACKDPAVHHTYLEINAVVSYLALICCLVMFCFGVYMSVRWRWVWMHDTAVPIQRYGEDIEDLEPGFLAVSSARSFLHGQATADATKREVEKAEYDLDKSGT